MFDTKPLTKAKLLLKPEELKWKYDMIEYDYFHKENPLQFCVRICSMWIHCGLTINDSRITTLYNHIPKHWLWKW